MNDAEKLGKLVLEYGSLEKQIGVLRDEAIERGKVFAKISGLLRSDPERIVFAGQSVDAQFAALGVIDTNAIEMDSLCAFLDELRGTITRKTQTRDSMRELGFDPEQLEDEINLRKSRALRGISADPNSAPENGRHIGFALPRKKTAR